MRPSHVITTLTCLAAFGLAACGQLASISTNAPGYSVDDAFTKVWEADLRLDQLRIVDIDPEGAHLLTGGADRRINLTLRDGRTGTERWREVDRGGIARFVEVQGVGLDDIRGERHEYLLLGDEVLVFRQHIGGDSFGARSSGDGKERWRQEGYSWSPAKWAGVGQVLANVVFESTGSVAGGSMVSAGSMLATSGSLVEDLTSLSPDGSLLLLLSGSGLTAFDRETGENRWQIDEFRGGRIAEVLELPDGDLIAVAGGNDVLADLVNRHYVARVNPRSGEVRWIEPYQRANLLDSNAPNFVQTELQGDVLLLKTAYLNVFDIDTGERRLSAQTHIREHGMPLVATDETAVYSVIDGMREVELGVFFGEQSRVFAADLVTGDEIWTTESSTTRIYDLLRHDDLLIVAAGGTLAGGESRLIGFDAATGEERWRTGPIEQVSALSRFVLTDRVEATRVTDLAVHGDKLIVGGPTAIYTFDSATGAEVLRIDHAALDLGRIHQTFLEADAVVAISEYGVSMFDPDTGEVLYRTDRQRVAGYFFAKDRLFLQRGNQVTVVDLALRDALGGFRTNPPVNRRLMGRLARGVAVTADGRSVFLLDRGGKVARFDL